MLFVLAFSHAQDLLTLAVHCPSHPQSTRFVGGKGTRYGLEISLSKWSYKPLNKLTGLSASEHCLGLSDAIFFLATAYKGRVLRLKRTHTACCLPWTVRYCVYFTFADRSFGRSLDIHASASLRLIVYFSCSYHLLVRFSTLSSIFSQLPNCWHLRTASPSLRVRYHLIIGNQCSFRNCTSNRSIGLFGAAGHNSYPKRKKTGER
jgi:hypothetical protein